MKTYWMAAAAAVVSLSASGADAATLVANYLFNGNLHSSVGGAPDLVAVDPTSSNSFVTDTVHGSSRTVYAVNGQRFPTSDQGGLTFDGTGLLTSDSYSVALTFEFLAGDGAWRRIVDVQDRQSDNGFYVDPSNHLNVFPITGSSAQFLGGVYRNVVLTVGVGGDVNAYIDGGSSLHASTSIMNLGPNKSIGLFIDNVVAGGQGEWYPSRIAVASFYNGVLTADEAARINGDPTHPPGSGGVPEPASWALMIMGFGAAGSALRRRRAVA